MAEWGNADVVYCRYLRGSNFCAAPLPPWVTQSRSTVRVSPEDCRKCGLRQAIKEAQTHG